MRHESRQHNPTLRRRGLTLIELLVTVGLIVIVIVSASQIFSITSNAAAVTEANSSLIQKSRAINALLEREVGNLAYDSFLAIVCPPPIRNTPELKGGPFIPQQVDAIAFGAHGNLNEFESFTDPTRPTPANPELGPVHSSEALIYFGPGTPLTQNPNGIIQPVPLGSIDLIASEWPFVHRRILLLPEVALTTNFNWRTTQLRNMDAQFAIGGIFNNTTALTPLYADGRIDAVVSSNTLRANMQTVSQIIMNKDWDTDLATDNPTITGLWSRSQTPRTVELDVNLATSRRDFYRRGGATFSFGLSDFRVEWTDGRPIDPLGNDGIPNTGDENLNTRWFGIRPDPDQDVTQAELNELVQNSGSGVPFERFRRHDVDPNQTLGDPIAEQALINIYRDRIEWPRTNAGTNTAMYRAIWRADTWQYRPKALRFTYRLFDRNQRIKNNVEVDFDRDGYPDPDFSLTKRQMVRMGREFSVVVPVP